MNWEAINAIAQLISSIGVVASLWYLAIQVHRSTRITRLAAQDAASTALRDVTRPFAENAESGRIWRIGLENSFYFPISESDGDDSLPLHLWIDG